MNELKHTNNQKQHQKCTVIPVKLLWKNTKEYTKYIQKGNYKRWQQFMQNWWKAISKGKNKVYHEYITNLYYNNKSINNAQEQIEQLLAKLINIIKLDSHTKDATIQFELLIIAINWSKSQKQKLKLSTTQKLKSSIAEASEQASILAMIAVITQLEAKEV